MEDEKGKTLEKDKGQNANLFVLFAKLSVWIAAPVLLATFIGNSWDQSHNSAPWGLLIAVGIAFPVSIAGLMIEANRAFRNISPDKEKDKNGYERDK